jgi:hypothetical protein
LASQRSDVFDPAYIDHIMKLSEAEFTALCANTFRSDPFYVFSMYLNDYRRAKAVGERSRMIKARTVTCEVIGIWVRGLEFYKWMYDTGRLQS